MGRADFFDCSLALILDGSSEKMIIKKKIRDIQFSIFKVCSINSNQLLDHKVDLLYESLRTKKNQPITLIFSTVKLKN